MKVNMFLDKRIIWGLVLRMLYEAYFEICVDSLLNISDVIIFLLLHFNR